jgi:hypothetical protein
MTDAWKPQPGKPAMMRDEKTLVTDLVAVSSDVFWSNKVQLFWPLNGVRKYWEDPLDPLDPRDLVKPTAAILAAHGIDADGKPVKGDENWLCAGCGKPHPGRLRACDCPTNFLVAKNNPKLDALKVDPPDTPAPSTRVDDRWFRLFERAIEGAMAGGAQNPDQCVEAATSVADLAFAEVAKREGR